MISAKLRQRLRRDRPITKVEVSIPTDLIADLDAVAAQQGIGGHIALIRLYISEGLRRDESKVPRAPDEPTIQPEGDRMTNDVAEFMSIAQQHMGDRPQVPAPTDPRVRRILEVLASELSSLTKWISDESERAVAAGAEDDQARAALRVRLLVEEMGELCEALARGDTTETADALVDILYVAIGAGLTFGIDLDRVWRVVHAANMAKFESCSAEGDHGVDCVCKGHRLVALRSPSGKVIKPDGWQKPDIKAEIDRQLGLSPSGT